MKLEDNIRDSIYEYPSLFRAKDYSSSRLHVLNHLFLVNGNGYEWHTDGYLTDGKKKERKTLPENYFNDELYEIQTNKAEELIQAFEKSELFFYKQMRWEGLAFIFQCDNKAKALEFYEKFAKKEFEIFDSFADSYPILNDIAEAKISDYFVDILRVNYPVDPYPICQYSAIQEILNGKTNSFYQDNFNLVVQPDWLQGCVEIALEAKEYYFTLERYENNYYYKDKNFWNEFRKGQLKILNEFLDRFNCTN